MLNISQTWNKVTAMKNNTLSKTKWKRLCVSANTCIDELMNI